jgi:hypothetical protein
MATINSDGKNAYIYNASDDTWYSIGGAVNTNQQYTWSADQEFTAATTFENVIKAKGGINNFQNATARDAVLTSPVAGLVCFVRQENDGSVIDQVQYYSGSEWRYVNDSATFVTKTSAYTVVKSDAGKTISVESSSDVVITIPLNSTTPFTVGQKIEFIRYGAGAVSFAGATVGVTIYSKNSNKKISSRYSGAVLTKVDTNTWLLLGDLTA